MQHSDTIFALATSSGRAGVAVLRVSGPQASTILLSLSALEGLPSPRKALYKEFFHPKTNDLLDIGLVLWFPGPNSFTGEDCVEFQVHGSLAVEKAFYEAFSTFKDVRLAEPGEFTRRAFYNQKMDLTTVEGLADLIEAETSVQRQLSLKQMKGTLSVLYEGWRERLKKSLAHAEVEIDFPDEDLPEDINADLLQHITTLKEEISSHLNDQKIGERLRSGLSIAILGKPNAGKSSLLNLLAQRDAAIVSEQAGTTRDRIEVFLDLKGYPVKIIDTAGLREKTEDKIEQEGIKRAKESATEADFKILLYDVQDDDFSTLQSYQDERSFLVANKIDLLSTSDKEALKGWHIFPLSTKTKEGLEAFIQALSEAVETRFSKGLIAPTLTRERHRSALVESLSSLEEALEAPLPELRAESLRAALHSLGRITGRVDIEELLDVVFYDFCLGK